MSNLNYDVKVGGAAQAAAEVGRVAEATRQAAAATAGQGAAAQAGAKGVTELGDAYEKGAGAGRVFGALLTGNIAALGGLGAALKAVGSVMRAGVWGALLSVLGLMAPLLDVVIRKLQGLRGAAAESGDAITQATAEAEKFGAVQLRALADDMRAIASQADEAVRRFREALALRGQLEDAQLAAEVGAIQSDPLLTPEEKKVATAAAQVRRSQSRAASEVSALEGEAGQRELGARNAGLVAEAAAQRAADAARRVQDLQRPRTELAQERVDLTSQSRELDAMLPLPLDYKARRTALDARLDEVDAGLRRSDSPGAMVAAEGEAAAAAKARDQALQDAAAARQRADEARRQLELRAPHIQAVAALEQEQHVRTAGAGVKYGEIEERVAREAITRVRAPRDLGAEEEGAVMRRAHQINTQALALDGKQAGETMGEAVALALKEVFPELTSAYMRAVRDEIRTAVTTEISRLDSQLKTLRTR